MNAYELNKFIGAGLAALVFAMGLSVISDIIFTEKALYEPAYRIEIASAVEEEVMEETVEVPFETLLASADPEAGAGAVRVCGACHSWDIDGPNGIGPALGNIVGREIAVVDGFGYSGALVEHGAGGKVWDWAELDGFLENPAGWVPGTIMGYGGIADREERADVIAYLASISPDGPALPTAAEVEVAAVETETVTDAAPEVTETVADEAVQEAAAEEAEPEVVEEAAVEEAAVQDDTTMDAVEEAPAVPAVEEDEAAAATSDVDPFVQLVASADPAAGASKAVICQACHNVAEGAGNKVGPNLWGVYGPAADNDFGYSAAMQAYVENVPEWNAQTLNVYLEAPMQVVPGTTMAYGGVKDEQERAEIIAWLHSLSPDAGPIIPAAGDAAVAASE